MNKFIGVKMIKAKAMNKADYNALRGWPVPSDENPAEDGYLVEYVDGGQANHKDFAGYISWSPKDVFERAYRQCSGLSFGLAVEALKQGAKLSRSGWNGNGMFIYHVPANSYPAQTGVAKSFFGEAAMVPYNAYLAIKNVDGTVSTWVPSINDVLADDWLITE